MGHNVLAIQGLNDSRTNSVFLIAPSLAASSTADFPQYLAMATPGRPNTSQAIEVVDSPQFSHPRGFYDASFKLTLSCATPGAVDPLHDGRHVAHAKPADSSTAPPSPSARPRASGPSPSSPAAGRAACETRTYIFPSDVAHAADHPDAAFRPCGARPRPTTRWTRTS